MSKNLLKKFAHGESNLLTENQFCSQRIMNCPSFYLQSKYVRMTRFLYTHKLLKAKKICSQEGKTAHKNQICSEQEFAQKIAHSRNLLTEFARSIEKLLTMKNLAGSDGSTRWLNVSHQANRSTAGAHHSMVSVVTARTCWAGPSVPVHACLVTLVIVPGTSTTDFGVYPTVLHCHVHSA